MKKGMLKRFLAVALAAVMAVSLVPVMGTMTNGAVGQVEAKAADIVDSGTCGNDTTWFLDSNGLLTISGSENVVRGMLDLETSAAVKEVIIENGMTSIDNGAFRKFSNLTDITIPNSVTYIGDSVFEDCSSLMNVTIPNSVTEIGYGAFEDCSSLVNITIPDSVTWIGTCTFQGCSSLTNITIPDNVWNIQEYAFSGCKSLTSVTIPTSVSSILQFAFAECDSLTDVYYKGSKLTWDKISIENDNECLTNAKIHYAIDTVSVTYDPGELEFSKDESAGFIHYNSEITNTGTVIISANADETIGVNCSYYWPYDSTGTYYATGWKLKGDDSGKIYKHGEKFTLGNANVTFEAVWKKKCVVTYDYNGGESALERTVHHVNRTEDEDYELYAGGIDSGCVSFGRNGFTFKGWQVKGLTDGKLYQKGDVYHLTGDVTFVAIWECNSHTWDAGKVTKAPTTTEEGEMTYTCTVCGETRTESIEKISVKTGWIQEDGYWYFYNTDGTKAVNTWKKDSKGWCYLGKDGKMATNRWVKDSKGWCYVGSDGYMVTNSWKKDSKGWCYVGSDGRMVTNGWAKDSKGWCWMGSDGYWVSNKWIKSGGQWYYIKSNHYMAANEWVKSGGYWYYLKSNGCMATGTLKISGKTYKFDSSGRWIS